MVPFANHGAPVDQVSAFFGVVELVPVRGSSEKRTRGEQCSDYVFSHFSVTAIPATD